MANSMRIGRLRWNFRVTNVTGRVVPKWPAYVDIRIHFPSPGLVHWYYVSASLNVALLIDVVPEVYFLPIIMHSCWNLHEDRRIQQPAGIHSTREKLCQIIIRLYM